MFLGIELVSWAVAAVGVLVLVLLFSYLSERAARRDEEHSRDFWYARTGEVIDRLEAATKRGDFYRDDYNKLHTSFVQVDSDLQDARATTERLHATLEGAEIVQNFLMDTVTELVDEVGDREEDVEDLEDALEETEQELDIADDSLDKAHVGWAKADEISTRALVWGERVLGLLEQVEKRRL